MSINGFLHRENLKIPDCMPCCCYCSLGTCCWGCPKQGWTAGYDSNCSLEGTFIRKNIGATMCTSIVNSVFQYQLKMRNSGTKE